MATAARKPRPPRIDSPYAIGGTLWLSSIADPTNSEAANTPTPNDWQAARPYRSRASPRLRHREQRRTVYAATYENLDAIESDYDLVKAVFNRSLLI